MNSTNLSEHCSLDLVVSSTNQFEHCSLDLVVSSTNMSEHCSLDTCTTNKLNLDDKGLYFPKLHKIYTFLNHTYFKSYNHVE